MGHNYHEEVTWGPRGPGNLWDRPDGTQGTYFENRAAEHFSKCQSDPAFQAMMRRQHHETSWNWEAQNAINAQREFVMMEIR